MVQELKVVLTGGIASGKSSVSRMLENSGFTVVSADDIAHKALVRNVSKIREIFGEEYVLNGEVDRRKLGTLVFGDTNKLRVLESILKNDIYNSIFEVVESLEKLKKPYVVDIPLFFERSDIYKANLTALVYASSEQQLNRLMARDNLSMGEAVKRIDSQMDIEKKRQMADIVIDNSRDLPYLQKEVENFASVLKDMYAGWQI